MECECLHAWIDSAPCICHDKLAEPKKIDLVAIANAGVITRKIETLKAFERKIHLAIKSGQTAKIQISVDIDSRLDPPVMSFNIPIEIAAGLVEYHKTGLYSKLYETGISIGK